MSATTRTRRSSTRARLYAVPRPTTRAGAAQSDVTASHRFHRPGPGGSAWRSQAACLSADPDVFFPEPGDTVTAAAAIAICDMCPVADACLADAIATRESYGIRGGLTARQRHQLRATRRSRHAQARDRR